MGILFSLFILFSLNIPHHLLASAEENATPPTSTNICENPIYRHTNNVTIKAKDCAVAGQEYEFEWETYYVARDKFDVIQKLRRQYNTVNEGNTYPANRIITTKLTDMSWMFGCYSDEANAIWGCALAEWSNIFNWDTSNVTDMSFMFNSPTHDFNEPIGDWDTSKVTNMEAMFSAARGFNQDISRWNVSNVTNMAYMFCNLDEFNQDISKWNVSNVTNMGDMFCSASAFNQDISGWNVSNVTNMEGMFGSASSFSQNLSSWRPNICEKPDRFDGGTHANFENNPVVQPTWKNCNPNPTDNGNAGTPETGETQPTPTVPETPNPESETTTPTVPGNSSETTNPGNETGTQPVVPTPDPTTPEPKPSVDTTPTVPGNSSNSSTTITSSSSSWPGGYVPLALLQDNLPFFSLTLPSSTPHTTPVLRDAILEKENTLILNSAPETKKENQEKSENTEITTTIIPENKTPENLQKPETSQKSQKTLSLPRTLPETGMEMYFVLLVSMIFSVGIFARKNAK